MKYYNYIFNYDFISATMMVDLIYSSDRAGHIRMKAFPIKAFLFTSILSHSESNLIRTWETTVLSGKLKIFLAYETISTLPESFGVDYSV